MTAKHKTPEELFREENAAKTATYRKDSAWQKMSNDWLLHALQQRYVYNFSWMGRPIIQLPQDMQAFQEIVWDVKPDLIIETGIAHGGSLIYSASLLALLDYADAVNNGGVVDPQNPARRVLGVDIDIREHNRIAVEAHPMASRIEMIQGSSVAEEVMEQVCAAAAKAERVLVCLDSNHTHEHVLAELERYAPLVSKGSYCIVFDTIVEDLPAELYPDRPWSPGDNPKTAVHAYLKSLRQNPQQASDGQPLQMEIDYTVEDKLLLTVVPDGFLKRV